mmetsp:Transcript_23270/g.59421  ORF Transcript_23270/g.59421 Transcript_23270/m.59421 type:complete len:315 (-) Transcript_23270:85-1029(-)
MPPETTQKLRTCECGLTALESWTNCPMCRKQFRPPPDRNSIPSAGLSTTSSSPPSSAATTAKSAATNIGATRGAPTRATWADLTEGELGLAALAPLVRPQHPISEAAQSRGDADFSDVPGHWLPSLSSSSQSGVSGRSARRRARQDGRTKSVDSEGDQIGSEGRQSAELDLLIQVPYDEEGEMTSIGSIGHTEGQCHPCAYWFKGVCAHGVTCRHCHFVHDGQKGKRLRPSKLTRQRLKNKSDKQSGCSDSLDGDRSEPPTPSEGRSGADSCSEAGEGDTRSQTRSETRSDTRRTPRTQKLDPAPTVRPSLMSL